ncbi:hypothetical protein JXM67_00005 [candidate division WOR-3 bacterium]|nr:hypothetical protein [candidate division WOR-3 bacterium]
MRHLIAAIAIIFLLASCTVLSHDVGVVDLVSEEGHAWGNPWTDPYPVGTEFTCVAAVKNFGSEPQHDVQVSLEIYDVTMEPDSLVWQDTQLVEGLEKRNIGKSDQIEVKFPVFTVPSEDWLRFDCRTELEVDEDLENDKYTTNINMAVAEIVDGPPFGFETIYPNPTRDSVRITYVIPHSTCVKLTVTDIQEVIIATPVNEELAAGRHSFFWNLMDKQGRRVSAGYYIVRMELEEVEDYSSERKIVIMD